MNPLVAMDTCFYSSFGAYDFDARCEMLRELGYDGTYLTLWSEAAWEDLPRLRDVEARHGLKVAAVYVTLDAAAPDDSPENNRILAMLESLEGTARVETAVRSSLAGLAPSDPAGDDRALTWLDRMLGIAARRGITVALYPHWSFWLERIEDGVRLCRRLDHPNLGALFCGFHWFAVDGTDLPARLQEAAPYLRSANVCGSRKPGVGAMPATIETLDQGTLDNFIVLAELQRAGHTGDIAIQGYGMHGDVYLNLERSLGAYRSMAQRLREHPIWAATLRR